MAFLQRTPEQFREELGAFVWDFKIGDNLVYNYEVLLALYAGMDMYEAEGLDPKCFHKPLTITLVSIIEVILADFLDRIDGATDDLPKNVDHKAIALFKKEIKQNKKAAKREHEGEEYIFMKRKMYHYGDLVKLFEKYEFFGGKEDPLYAKLREFGDWRNRIHIENYHNNLARDERNVFTESRLDELEEILEVLFTKMKTDYKRRRNQFS